MGNRRRAGRVQLRRLLKRIPAAFEAGDLRARGEIAKLSRKGLFFCTETLPAPGSPVRVIFEDRHGSKIELQGSVRWNTAQLDPARSGFGMHIDRPSGEYQEFYEQLLTQ